MDCAELLQNMIDELKQVNVNLDNILTVNMALSSDIEAIKDLLIGASNG